MTGSWGISNRNARVISARPEGIRPNSRGYQLEPSHHSGAWGITGALKVVPWPARRS